LYRLRALGEKEEMDVSVGKKILEKKLNLGM